MMGYGVFLDSNLIHWSVKKQPTVACLSAKAAYHAMAAATVELTWVSFLLHDLGFSLPVPSTIVCDNTNALCMSINPIFHACTKHIKKDYYFIREKVSQAIFITKYVHISNQLADLLLSHSLGNHFRVLVTSWEWCLPHSST